jgi:Carboxypeptidase regulatory-like domain/TonB-dependent Receptor Plug Domain
MSLGRPLSNWSAAFACVIAVLALPVPARAQATATATLRGTIRDSSGGVLPGAAITLTNQSTAGIRTTNSDARGEYAFVAILPGTYMFEAGLSGFRTYQQSLPISPQDALNLNVVLEIGEQIERVTVTGKSDLVRTDTGAREGVLSASQISKLSVISRSALELLRILPGVVAPDPSTLESVSFMGGANDTRAYTVNGIRSTNNTVQLDGSSTLDIGCNCGSIVTLNDEMVQEVKVQGSNYAAEYGSAAVGISAITKSGTSALHGAIYGFNRDYHLASNDLSNVEFGLPKPHSLFNYIGGNIGGPVVVPGWDYTKGHDRLFFFAAAEVQRQRIDLGARIGVVPTSLQRQGIFTEFLTPDGSNLGQTVGPVLIPPGFDGAGSPAPGADLGPYIDPLGRVLADLYPAPTGRYQDNRYNYAANALEPNNRLDMKARVDWNISTNTRAYVRVAYENEDVEDAYGVWGSVSGTALPSPQLQQNRGRSISANVVSVLSPTSTNEALASWTRGRFDNPFRDPSLMRLDHYDVSWTGPFAGASPNLPSLQSDTLSSVAAFFHDVFAHEDTLEFSDKLTKLAGAHALKFGGSAARLQKQQNLNNYPEGLFTYAPSWTPGSTTNVVGDLLTGRLTQFTQGTSIPTGRFRMWNFEGFAQDSWKVRPNLTVEYGLRGGYWPNNVELGGLGGYFDPNLYKPGAPTFVDSPFGSFTRLNGVCYVSTGCAQPGLLPDRLAFLMPRVNAVWAIDDRAVNVLRGGYGEFFNRPSGGIDYNLAFTSPPVYSLTVDGFQGAGFGNGLGLTYQTAAEATLEALQGTVSMWSITPRSFAFPRTQSFSVSYARRIFFDQTVEAAYVGTRGTHLPGNVDDNSVPEGTLLSGTIGNADLSVPVNRVALDPIAVNQFRPFQAYSHIGQQDFEGVSRYNSLQITLSRPGNRLQYFAAYTLSRTTGTFGGDTGFRDPFDPSRTYGVLDSDRTHTLTVSWNAMVPDGARGALDHAVLRGILNGWQLSGISTLVSGEPIRLVLGGDTAGSGIFQAYYGTPDIQSAIGSAIAPTYTCDPRLSGHGEGDKVLDINCIGIPALGQNGQALPPYNIREPWRQTHDLTVFKTFGLGQARTLEFRVGIFNVFNVASNHTINLGLSTKCNAHVDGVPNGVGGFLDQVCDPAKGFSFTPDTVENFGRIISDHGHRVVELSAKFSF